MNFKFPDEFERRMRQQLGNEFDDFTLSHSTVPPVSIRLNPSKSFEVPGTPVPWTKFGRYLPIRPTFALDPHWHAGSYYVQEASSMFLEKAALATGKPEKILDLCAAPGGKSTHLISLFPESLVVSNEVIRSRAGILSENITRWGYPNNIVTNNDPADFNRLPGFFDLIVVDAPCSGEGLFRKDHNSVNEWSEAAASMCASRQSRILHDVWPALKERGHMIYCTCTYNPNENESNLLSFSRSQDVEFVKLDIPGDWGIVEINAGDAVGYRFHPHKTRGEGFFLSVMKKKSDANRAQIRILGKVQKMRREIKEQISSWIHDDVDVEILNSNEEAFLFPSGLVNSLEVIQSTLRTVSAGTKAAIVKHDKLIPQQAMAMSILVNHSGVPCVDLDNTNAIRFLKKESPNITNVQPGFTLATYDSQGLGWMNVLPNRINNLYPSNWRLRKGIDNIPT